MELNSLVGSNISKEVDKGCISIRIWNSDGIEILVDLRYAIGVLEVKGYFHFLCNLERRTHTEINGTLSYTLYTTANEKINKIFNRYIGAEFIIVCALTVLQVSDQSRPSLK